MKIQDITIQPSIKSNNDMITFWNHKGKQVSMTLEDLIQNYNSAMKKKEAYWFIFQNEKIVSKVLKEKLKRTEELWERKHHEEKEI